MPIGKYFGYVGSALLALLFVLDACFGDGEANTRFDPSLFDSATYASRQQEVVTPYEFRYPRELTPAARVRDVFAQFMPGEGKSGKRYSSVTSFVR